MAGLRGDTKTQKVATATIRGHLQMLATSLDDIKATSKYMI